MKLKESSRVSLTLLGMKNASRLRKTDVMISVVAQKGELYNANIAIATGEYLKDPKALSKSY